MDYTNYRRFEIIRMILDNNPAAKSPKQIAVEMDRALSTVLKWGEDPEGSGSPLPRDLEEAFIRVTQDKRLYEWYLSTVILKPAVETDGDVYDNLLNLDIQRGEFSEEFKGAMQDKQITADELKRLRDILSRMIREISTLTMELTMKAMKQA